MILKTASMTAVTSESKRAMAAATPIALLVMIWKICCTATLLEGSKRKMIAPKVVMVVEKFLKKALPKAQKESLA